jgi:hypothetical protein
VRVSNISVVWAHVRSFHSGGWWTFHSLCGGLWAEIKAMINASLHLLVLKRIYKRGRRTISFRGSASYVNGRRHSIFCGANAIV